MTWWIALWFSSMTLLSPATQYAYVPLNVGALNLYKHTYAVFNTTADVGAYMDSLAGLENEVTIKTIYRGPEQRLILSNGKPIFLGTKFLAPNQYSVLSYDESFSSHAFIGSTSNSIDREEFYTVSDSSTDLINYTLLKAKQTGYDYKIYRGEQYVARDNGRSFTFKKIP